MYLVLVFNYTTSSTTKLGYRDNLLPNAIDDIVAGTRQSRQNFRELRTF